MEVQPGQIQGRTDANGKARMTVNSGEDWQRFTIQVWPDAYHLQLRFVFYSHRYVLIHLGQCPLTFWPFKHLCIKFMYQSEIVYQHELSPSQIIEKHLKCGRQLDSFWFHKLLLIYIYILSYIASVCAFTCCLVMTYVQSLL